MEVVIYRRTEFLSSIQEMMKAGGTSQMAAKRVMQIVGALGFGERLTEKLGKLTKHGESRIPHCFKFDLPGFHRLVCVQHDDILSLLYVGTHESCERWLESNKGLRLVVDKNTHRISIIQEVDAKEPLPQRPINMWQPANSPLLDHIQESDIDVLPLRPSDIRRLSLLTTASEDDELQTTVLTLPEGEIQNLMLSVLLALREGNITEATILLHKYIGEVVPGDRNPEMLKEALNSEVNSDFVINLRELSEIEIEHLFKRASFEEWMLFLHPDQKRLVTADFKRALLLKGVSGSGKTSVLVHRAKSLAEKYPESQIAIFTINGALSALITQLLDKLCPPPTREHIKSKAIYDLCYEIVKFYNPNEHLLDFDPRSKETLEDCWLDSYQWSEQQETLAPIIKSLSDTYGIDPSRYIRDEFVWVRSAFADNLDHSQEEVASALPVRQAYLDPDKTPREGRSIRFTVDWRRRIIDALRCYEEWLSTGGFVDPAALSLAAHRYIGKLREGNHPFKYRCILVDEEQDLGTVELEVIAALASDQENPLFLAGDMNQQVFPKHHDLNSAGIQISSSDRRYLRRNYRNTRQILQAGLTMLKNFGQSNSLEDEDFKALDPELSSRESSKPLVIAADGSQEERHFIRHYIDERKKMDNHSPICIVACGIREDNYHEINHLQSIYESEGLSLKILDKESKLSLGTIFLSPLETVKGFEFSLVIIAHCGEKQMPDLRLPSAESWRDARRLYVAMTRARDELLFTYEDKPSRFLEEMREHILWSSVSDQHIAS